MNAGQLTIWIAFFSALGGACFYFLEGKNNLQTREGKSSSPNKQRLSRWFYLIMMATGLTATLILYDALLSHQFQYSYVAHYSSRELPLFYLISAFWAGQEGTFLLWALLVGVMGLIFRKTLRNEDGYAMSVVSGFAAFLYLLLIVKSPFEITQDIPPDGSGLNPLLQDPWMVIHPPILFVGYAAVTFPFALVIAALARREYRKWLDLGFSWTLFAAVTLGAGIIIGGFWAYEVLGWGGYWGWDPVENSSLVPWLLLLALIHGFVVQKTKGSLMKTNFVLVICAFFLVLYATFLTRSGVLADFSVHSFVDLGITWYLIAIMIVTLVLGFGLFIARFREMQAPKVDVSSFNREFMLVLSLIALCAIALFTLVGTSSPLLTGLVGKASQVDTSFYNEVNLPLAIVIALLLSITPFTGWVEEQKAAFVKRSLFSFGVTVISAIVAYAVGVTSWLLLVFIASAAFAMWSNIIVAVRQFRVSWMNIGAPVSHIGVGLLLIGIVGSGSFDDSTKLVLTPDVPRSAYGHQFTFKGISENPGEKAQVNIEVSDGKMSFIATPKLYYSEYNHSMMREPDIKVSFLKDLYVSPLELRTSGAEDSHPTMEITKGETKYFEEYKITFVRFETGAHAQTSAMTVGAVLQVNIHEKVYEVIPQLMINERGEREIQSAELPALQLPAKAGAHPQVTLDAMNVDEKTIVLGFHGFKGLAATMDLQELIVDISIKPLMTVVWSGAVLMLVGILIAIRRHILLRTK
jgi:cytochrome c-type biogenesis protein CcmF